MQQLPHLLLCSTTFKRDWQLKQSLPLNLPQTVTVWQKRVTWCIFDANISEDLWNWARQEFAPLIQGGHLIWLRCAQKSGWETFHCSIAKNAAHHSGFEASLADRMRAIDEAGLTAMEEDLTAKTFVVNWDNDGVLCLKWLHDALRTSADICEKQDSSKPIAGVQWQNKHMGTFGRIGLPWKMFKKVGGYDESMLAISCQDVC